VQLGKVPRLGQPVVHLQVYVQVVVPVPGCLDGVGPEALQVGGKLSRTGRGDEQVTSKLIIEGIQARVGLILVGGQPQIRGQG